MSLNRVDFCYCCYIIATRYLTVLQEVHEDVFYLEYMSDYFDLREFYR